MKKILSVLFDIVIVFVIIFAIVITFMSLNTNDKGITSINGYSFFNVQTGSMEPTIKSGDLIISKVEDFDSLKVNDIISFMTREQEKTVIKTHRIVEIKNEDGIKSLVTKGDANDSNDEKTVEINEYVASYTGTKIPCLGKILTFLQSQAGFFVFIIIPLFIVFIYQMYKFVSLIIEQKKNEMVEQIKKEQLQNNELK